MLGEPNMYTNRNEFHLEDYSSDEEFEAPEIQPGLDYWHEKSEAYFEKIIQQFSPALKEDTKPKPGLIIVVHPVPTLPAFIKALTKIGIIRHVIIKGKENSKKRDSATIKWLRAEWTPQQEVQPEIHDKDIKSKEFKEELWGNHQRAIDMVTGIPEEHCMIMDIGGYFAPALESLMANEACREKLLGIIEDTENGHQLYKDRLQEFLIYDETKPCPVYSVARAEIKKTEDYNVGKSIVQATDSMLRTQFNRYLETFECIGVIGFGKIGSSIAAHLRAMHAKNVLVCDINPNLAMIAASQDFKVATKDTLKRSCDLIFCATGNKSINAGDLKTFVQENVFIASCTSPDSEFDLEGATYNLASNEQQNPYDIYKYRIRQTKYFQPTAQYRHVYMLAHGEAINFYQKAVVGPYIRCVQSGIMVAAIRLLYKEDEIDRDQYELITLQPGTETKISQIWLQAFHEVYKDNTSNYLGIPKPNLGLVSRKEDIDKLMKELKLNSMSFREFNNYKGAVFVKGDSGVGKTELVKEFINKSFIENEKGNRFYDLIHWLDFDSLGLYEQFINLTIKLGIGSGVRNITQLTDAIVNRLKYNTNYLLVIDGIENESKTELIEKFLSLIPSKDIYKEVGRRHIILLGKYIPTNADRSSIKKHTVNNFSNDDSKNYVKDRFSKTDLREHINDFMGLEKKVSKLSKNFNTLVLEKTVAYIINEGAGADINELLNGFKNLAEIPDTKKRNVTALEYILKFIIDSLEKKHQGFKTFILCLVLLPEKYLNRELLTTLSTKLDIPDSMNTVDELENYSILTLPQKRRTETQKSDDFVFHKGVRKALDKIVGNRLPDIYTHIVGLLHELFTYDYYMGNEKNSKISYLHPYIEAIKTQMIDYVSQQDTQKINKEIFMKTSELLYRYALFSLYEARDHDGAALIFKKLKYKNIINDSKYQFLQLRASLEKIICDNYLIKSGELYNRNLYLMSSLPDEASLQYDFANTYILIKPPVQTDVAREQIGKTCKNENFYYIDRQGNLDSFAIDTSSQVFTELLQNIASAPLSPILNEETLKKLVQNAVNQNQDLKIKDTHAIATWIQDMLPKTIDSKPLQSILDKAGFQKLWKNLVIEISSNQIKSIDSIIKSLQKLEISENDLQKLNISLIEAYITLSYSARNLFDLTNESQHLESAKGYLDEARQTLNNMETQCFSTHKSLIKQNTKPNWYLILGSAIDHAKGGNFLASGKCTTVSSETDFGEAIKSFRSARDQRKEVIRSFRDPLDQENQLPNSIGLDSNFLTPNLARTYYKLAEAFYQAGKNNKQIETPKKARRMNKSYYESKDCILKAKKYCTLAFDAQNSLFFGKSSSDFEQTRRLMDKIKDNSISQSQLAGIFNANNSIATDNTDLINETLQTPIRPKAPNTSRKQLALFHTPGSDKKRKSSEISDHDANLPSAKRSRPDTPNQTAASSTTSSSSPQTGNRH